GSRRGKNAAAPSAASLARQSTNECDDNESENNNRVLQCLLHVSPYEWLECANCVVSTPSAQRETICLCQPLVAERSSTFMSSAICTECGGVFAADDLIRHVNAQVCANCKPAFLQKLSEGAEI